MIGKLCKHCGKRTMFLTRIDTKFGPVHEDCWIAFKENQKRDTKKSITKETDTEEVISNSLTAIPLKNEKGKKMKVFDVYKHPTRGYEAVKIGFSWPALFFTWIWAFIKQLWGYGVTFIGAIFVLVMIETVFKEEGSEGGVLVMALLELGVFIWFGVMGNKWRKSNLEKRGYENIQTLQAETPDAAIASVAKPNASEEVNS